MKFCSVYTDVNVGMINTQWQIRAKLPSTSQFKERLPRKERCALDTSNATLHCGSCLWCFSFCPVSPLHAAGKSCLAPTEVFTEDCGAVRSSQRNLWKAGVVLNEGENGANCISIKWKENPKQQLLYVKYQSRAMSNSSFSAVLVNIRSHTC